MAAYEPDRVHADKLSLVIGATLLMSFAFFFVFGFANAFNLNVDDASVLYSVPQPNLFDAHATNRRFLTAAICAFLARIGTDYYDLIGLWSLLFVGSIYYLAFEIARYLKLGFAATAWISIAAASHGLMADLYPFTMGYLNYAGALVGAGMIITGLSLLPRSPIWAVLVATAGSLACLGSYQPFIVLPAIIFVIGQIAPAVGERTTTIPAMPVALLLISTIIGLASVVIFSSIYVTGEARCPSLVTLLQNLPNLFVTFFQLYFSGNAKYGLLFPTHERVLYFGASTLFITFAVVRSVRWNSKSSSIALLLYALGLLVLLSGPFNALLVPYWPAARSLSYSAFVGPAMVALLVSRTSDAEPRLMASRLQHWKVFAATVAFCSLSIANQLSLYYGRYLQKSADLGLAQSIVSDLRNAARSENTGLADTPVAVHSTWRNYAQRPENFLGYGMSAFSTPWSNIAILRAVSGLKFPSFASKEGQCPSDIKDYKIVRVDRGWLVCLN